MRTLRVIVTYKMDDDNEDLYKQYLAEGLSPQFALLQVVQDALGPAGAVVSKVQR